MRILLVEDDPRIIRNVKAALEAASYAVDGVSDGEGAWFEGDTQDYDAVILDLEPVRLALKRCFTASL